MTQRFARHSLIFVAVPACLALAAACSSDPAAPSGSSGAPATGGSSSSGSSSGGSATQPTAGTGLGGGAAGTPANTSGASAGGMTGGGSGGATSGGSGSGGAGGSAGGSAGTGGSASGGSGGGKVPACVTSDINAGVNRVYIECDVEEQAIDFDVMTAYPQGRDPGYDPSTTPVSFTDFGSGFTGSVVHECHPYCYRANLTIGLDVLAGNEASTKGEALFAFPPTVAPIANAKGRDSLGWVYLDGPALPQGTKVTVQMVLKATGKAPVLGTGTHDLPKGQWVEFKYFPIQQGFADADLLNVTHIGFRATVSPAPAADWHGVIYVDHFQLRQ